MSQPEVDAALVPVPCVATLMYKPSKFAGITRLQSQRTTSARAAWAAAMVAQAAKWKPRRVLSDRVDAMDFSLL
jgi:hypothetical protein